MRVKKHIKKAGKMTKKAFQASIKPLKVHVHMPPTCRSGKHDASCSGKGKEIRCQKISWKGISVCVCPHWKI